jgi:hypothetical protein
MTGGGGLAVVGKAREKVHLEITHNATINLARVRQPYKSRRAINSVL